jgi:hypothetical protein
MTSTLLNKAGKKLFEQHMEKYAPTDPLYEFYTDEKGKKKRRKVRRSTDLNCSCLVLTKCRSAKCLQAFLPVMPRF